MNSDQRVRQIAFEQSGVRMRMSGDGDGRGLYPLFPSVPEWRDPEIPQPGGGGAELPPAPWDIASIAADKVTLTRPYVSLGVLFKEEVLSGTGLEVSLTAPSASGTVAYILLKYDAGNTSAPFSLLGTGSLPSAATSVPTSASDSLTVYRPLYVLESYEAGSDESGEEGESEGTATYLWRVKVDLRLMPVMPVRI